MEHRTAPPEDPAEVVAREAAMIESAVRLVASRRVRAVTLAGLTVAVAAIALARPVAEALGITVEPLWGIDQHLTDVRIRLP